MKSNSPDREEVRVDEGVKHRTFTQKIGVLCETRRFFLDLNDLFSVFSCRFVKFREQNLHQEVIKVRR